MPGKNSKTKAQEEDVKPILNAFASSLDKFYDMNFDKHQELMERLPADDPAIEVFKSLRRKHQNSKSARRCRKNRILEVEDVKKKLEEERSVGKQLQAGIKELQHENKETTKKIYKELAEILYAGCDLYCSTCKQVSWDMRIIYKGIVMYE